ncbi:MAG: cation:proton antiporter [Actinomycetota bacterium]
MNEVFASLAFSAVIALALAVLLRHFGLSIALPLIAAGALVALSPWGPDALPDPEIVLVAILAPLVFGEALSSSFLDLRKVSRQVLLLAIGLVVATTVVVGGVAVWIAAMPLAAALALGAVLAPTDAVAVSTVAKKASLPRRIISILEGESLVNDGTGLTALRVAVAAAIVGSVTLLEVGEIFALAVVVGVGFGALSGVLLSQVLRRTRDAVASNALILVAPFAIYLGTEHLEGSGILAVVVAALWIAHAQHSEPGSSGRLQATYVWKHITFIFQAVAFFCIGLEFPDVFGRLPDGQLPLVPGLVAAVLLALILTRFVFVFGILGVTPQYRKVDAWGRAGLVIAWAGARGPVSGLAAFSIPLTVAAGTDFPFRDVILATTFSIIVITLVLSLTIAPLARALKIKGEDNSSEVRRIDTMLARAALERLDAIIAEAEITENPLDPQVIQRLRDDALARIERAEDARESRVDEHDANQQRVSVSLSMVHAEQSELIRIRDEEGVPDALIRPIMRDLDVRAEALEAR